MFDHFYKIFVGITVLFISCFIMECIFLRNMPAVDLSLNGEHIIFPDERKIAQKRVYWEKVNGLWGQEKKEALQQDAKLFEENLLSSDSIKIEILAWAESPPITNVFISIDGKMMTVQSGDYLPDYCLTIKNFSCCREESVRGLKVTPALRCYDEVLKKEFIVKANK